MFCLAGPCLISGVHPQIAGYIFMRDQPEDMRVPLQHFMGFLFRRIALQLRRWSPGLANGSLRPQGFHWIIQRRLDSLKTDDSYRD